MSLSQTMRKKKYGANKSINTTSINQFYKITLVLIVIGFLCFGCYGYFGYFKNIKQQMSSSLGEELVQSYAGVLQPALNSFDKDIALLLASYKSSNINFTSNRAFEDRLKKDLLLKQDQILNIQVFSSPVSKSNHLDGGFLGFAALELINKAFETQKNYSEIHRLDSSRTVINNVFAQDHNGSKHVVLISRPLNSYSKLLEVLGNVPGYIEIQQKLPGSTQKIVAVGSQSAKSSKYQYVRPLGYANWELAFWLSPDKLPLNNMSSLIYWLALGASLILLLIAIAANSFRFKKLINQDFLLLYDAVKSLGELKSYQAPLFQLKELNYFKWGYEDLAKAATREAIALNSMSKTSLPSALEDLHTDTLEEVVEQGLSEMTMGTEQDLQDIATEQSAVQQLKTNENKTDDLESAKPPSDNSLQPPASLSLAMGVKDSVDTNMNSNVNVSPQIFRACDIRGVVGETLTKDVAKLIGLSFGSMAINKGQPTAVVGRDGRSSGAMLVEGLTEGLLSAGMNVIDIGMVPTPVVYYATHALETGTGIMVTGSHNPTNYNGFKMMIGKDTLAKDEISQLYSSISAKDFVQGQGAKSSKDLIDAYIDRIVEDVKITKPLKIVVDCGSGVCGVLADKLFSALGCEVIPLYCDVDSSFPYHHPDPGQPENLEDLIHTVIAMEADLGIAFDGDGDRLGVVSDKGEIIWPDRLMMMFSEDLLERNPNAKIIYDVKCSKLLEDVISKASGTPIMYKTGHALIKRKMAETGALLGGEMSGHFFFKERWYGFDDACYAAARLLEIISSDPEGRKPSSIFNSLPDSVNTPEINIAISEDKKFKFIEDLKKEHQFQDANLITVDGLRVEFPDGWGLVRASNTTPCLVLRFEAQDDASLTRIKNDFRKSILDIDPKLELPF